MPDCDGSIDRVGDSSYTGAVLRISCCPTVPVQESEFISRWKQVGRASLSTLPIPFGFASFSTVSDIEVSGPPEPGQDRLSITRSGRDPMLPPDPGGGGATTTTSGTDRPIGGEFSM